MIDLFIPVNNIMPIYLNMIEYDLCHLGCPKGMKTKRVLISWVFFLFLSSYSMQMTDVVVLNFEVVTVFHVMSYFDSIRYNMDHFLSSLSLWQAKCYKYLTKTKSHQIKTSTMERMHARTTESKNPKASSLNYAIKEILYKYRNIAPCCRLSDGAGGRYPVRLVRGPTPASGRVEILYGDRWGTVCGDFWDNTDARYYGGP